MNTSQLESLSKATAMYDFILEDYRPESETITNIVRDHIASGSTARDLADTIKGFYILGLVDGARQRFLKSDIYLDEIEAAEGFTGWVQYAEALIDAYGMPMALAA